MPLPLSISLCYVSPDIERIIGIPTHPLFSCFTKDTARNRKLAKGRNDISFLSEIYCASTEDMLVEIDKQKYIPKKTSVVVFKNTTRIESICKKAGWRLLNPSARLAKTVEEKISQVKWLEEDAGMLPPHHITTPKEMTMASLPCIIQFNHGHTGTGTQLVKTKEELENIQNSFPNRPVRISNFLSGTMYTGNCAVSNHAIYAENISCQITGIAPYAAHQFQTIGNDWGYAINTLSDAQKKSYKDIALRVGTRLQKQGWRGLFGIDILCEKDTGKMYLIEINARQPASSTYESLLQNLQHPNKKQNEYTTMELHIAALQNILPKNASMLSVQNGAQLFDRRTTTPTAQHFSTSILKDEKTLTI